MSKTITHRQITPNSFESDCNLCSHSSVCFKLFEVATLRRLRDPYEVIFQCGSWDPETEEENDALQD